MKRFTTSSFSFCLISLLLTFSSCQKETVQADYQIIPLPQQIQIQNDENPFIINDQTQILYPSGNEKLKDCAQLLAKYIKEKTHKEITIATGKDKENAILLQTHSAGNNPEGYQLEINSHHLIINGNSDAGVFYGIQSLRKALPFAQESENIELPAAHINDFPRFPYRGAHLDVSRHFFSVEEIKTYLDMMALHNMNTLHWHLTDDQGWRIESKKYPLLTQIGSKRKETLIGHLNDRPEKYDGKPYSGFYTQEQIKDIVNYAAKNHITIIPEIDLPGHMQAALASYPELGCTGEPYEVWTKWGISENVLCAGNPKTYQFLDDIFDELTKLFPSPYIHIGGDECPKTQWKRCPKCQAFIREQGIKSDSKYTKEQYLQSFIMKHVTEYLKQKGRKTIGWDEILEGYPNQQVTVMSWRGEAGGIKAAQQGHDVIMTPNSVMYFDFYQALDTEKEPLAIGGYIPVEKIYNYDPVPSQLTEDQKKHILGVQSNLWTEYIPDFSHAQYMVLPRWAALAEIQWSDPNQKDYSKFLNRLGGMLKLYDLEKYNYAKHVLNVEATYTSNTETGCTEVTLSTLGNAPIHYTLDGSLPTMQSPVYKEKIQINKTTTLQAIAIRPEGNSELYKQQLYFNKATDKPITLRDPADEKYSGQGSSTLVDGISGNATFGSGKWLGFSNGKDMVATINLKQQMPVSSVSLHTCIATGDGVFDAHEISVELSTDGKSYQKVASETCIMPKEHQKGVKLHTLTFTTQTAQYVRITAISEKQMPTWSGFPPTPAFIFVDELSVD